MDYGDMLALAHFWGQLQLSEIINRHAGEAKVGFDVADMVKILVLNRSPDPMPKLGTLRLLETVFIPDLHAERVACQFLLLAMDQLTGAKKKLESDLSSQMVTLFSPKVDLVFCDIASSYSEGDGPEIAECGCSREHRPDRKQIFIALAVTREGVPMLHEVLPGSTAGVSIMQAAVSELGERFIRGKVASSATLPFFMPIISNSCDVHC